MAKLKLDLDALEVESFDTDQDAPEARGTVHGNAIYTINGCILSPLCVGTYQAWCQTTGSPIYV